jgi:autotransporter-associated beta strand protein
MRTSLNALSRRTLHLAVMLTAGSFVASAAGQSGTWTNAAGGDWNVGSNWAGLVIAAGPDNTANFNTLDAFLDVSVNLPDPVTVGNFIFGDTDTSSFGNWILGGQPITLAGAAPTITVNQLFDGSYVQINNTLAGTNGFTKAGVGELRIGAAITSTSGINIAGGTLSLGSNTYDVTQLVTMGNNTALNIQTGIGQNTAGGGGLRVLENSAATIRVTGTQFLSNVSGQAGSSLAISGDAGATVTLDRDWIRDGGFASLDLTGTGGAPTFFRLRPNGGTFNGNSFVNTAVTVTNGQILTRTNSGGNDINFGSLAGDSASILEGGNAGTVARYNIGTLNTSTEFAGEIRTGAGIQINKVGTGTLTLSGNLTYGSTFNSNAGLRGGITTVTAGTLKLTSFAAIPGGTSDLVLGELPTTIDIRADATLDVSETAVPYGTADIQQLIGAGTIAGNYTHSRGTLAPGNTRVGNSHALNNVAGTLTFSDTLTIDGGILRLDVSPSTTSGNDLISAAGLVLGGSPSVRLNLLGGAGVGTYTLMTSTSAIAGDVSGWNVVWPGRGDAPVLGINGSVLELTVAAGSFGSVSWSGASGNLWDINTSNNWYNAAPGVTNPDRYFELDSVTFADTFDGVNPVGNTNITLNDIVAPSAVVFDHSVQSYEINGTGRIGGTTSLVKRGSGELRLLTANNYAGLTTIEAGSVNLGTAGSFGTGGTVLHSVTLTAEVTGGRGFGLITINPGSTTNINFNGGAVANIANFTLGGSGTLNLSTDLGGKIVDINDTSDFGGILNVDGIALRLSNGVVGFDDVAVNLLTTASIRNRSTSVGTVALGSLSGGTDTLLQGYQGGATATLKTWVIGGLNTDSTFSGQIIDGSGTAGGVTTVAPTDISKVGTGTLYLNGTTSYTGVTTVSAGTLRLGEFAQAPVLTNVGGANILGGRLVLDYSTDATEASPAAAVLAALDASYDTGFQTGQIRSTGIAAPNSLGWLDDAANQVVIVAFTLVGDTNLDGSVGFTDLLALAQSYNNAGVWAQGDFDYDGQVGFTDLLGLAQNYNASLLLSDASRLSGAAPNFSADFAMAMSLVPEPSTLGVLGAAGLVAMRRRR